MGGGGKKNPKKEVAKLRKKKPGAKTIITGSSKGTRTEKKVWPPWPEKPVPQIEPTCIGAAKDERVQGKKKSSKVLAVNKKERKKCSKKNREKTGKKKKKTLVKSNHPKSEGKTKGGEHQRSPE